MRQLLKVWAAIALTHGFVLAAAPAEAADGVVLVGCDLFSRDGPSVAFVQSHGVKAKSKRHRFISGPSFRSAAFEGRDCAEVLSEVVDDGLEFQAMNVFGQDSDLALWFFQD